MKKKTLITILIILVLVIALIVITVQLNKEKPAPALKIQVIDTNPVLLYPNDAGVVDKSGLEKDEIS